MNLLKDQVVYLLFTGLKVFIEGLSSFFLQFLWYIFNDLQDKRDLLKDPIVPFAVYMIEDIYCRIK